MKNWLFIGLMAPMFLLSCQQEAEVMSTRSSTYLLHRANYNPTNGQVTITEIAPGKLQVHIQLNNTQDGYEHPAHLHFGSVREVGELAFRLNPVDGATGESLTVIDQVVLSNDSLLTYDMLLEMDGSVKIHMNDTFFKHMVLAFGNIGKNEDYLFDGVAVCTGH